MQHAVGSFEVKLVPSTRTPDDESSFGQMSFTKIISGDMSGTSRGLMVTSSTPSTGAMAYAAVEIVTASLDDRDGSFAFIHNATMKKSEPGSESLNISVVPGSGTGDLTGISGTFAIHIDAKGRHTYVFDYKLP